MLSKFIQQTILLIIVISIVKGFISLSSYKRHCCIEGRPKRTFHESDYALHGTVIPFRDEKIESASDNIGITDSLSIKNIGDDLHFTPGNPGTLIENAPGNARRIFAGIDIKSDGKTVWDILTSYDNLQDIVPSLVENQVLERYENGAKLKQIGAAKVLPGIKFTAKTVLDVRTYLEPLPESMLAAAPPPGCNLSEFAKTSPLIRQKFPRPFALSSASNVHYVITMENIANEGDFDFYQGVWRIQTVPFCLPTSSSELDLTADHIDIIFDDVCRLTYAVEIRPKGILPVRLIEGRIASDLQENLLAIKKYAESQTLQLVNSH